MNEFKIEDGRYWYYGVGAEGERWYNFGPAAELLPDPYGNETRITAEEAVTTGRIAVADTGPYVAWPIAPHEYPA